MFMLAKMGDIDILRNSDYIYEPKLDGTRAMLFKEENEIRFINRRGYIITRRYPELDPVNNLNCNSCILDGEIIVYNSDGLPDFHLLQLRDLLDSSRDIEIKSQIYPATYVVFDILHLDGMDLREKPLLDRKKILREVVRENDRLQIIPYWEDGKELWKMVKSLNIEGIMAKRKDSKYEAGRSDKWLKIKYFKTTDAVIVGYTPGKGKRKDTFGALLLGVYAREKLKFIGKVGTGFDEWTVRKILNLVKKGDVYVENPPSYEVIWVRPELVCEVQYLEITADGKLRTPSFKRLRFDKKPEECVLEVQKV